jgi:hypothetical protein
LQKPVDIEFRLDGDEHLAVGDFGHGEFHGTGLIALTAASLS